MAEVVRTNFAIILTFFQAFVCNDSATQRRFSNMFHILKSAFISRKKLQTSSKLAYKCGCYVLLK